MSQTTRDVQRWFTSDFMRSFFVWPVRFVRRLRFFFPFLLPRRRFRRWKPWRPPIPSGFRANGTSNTLCTKAEPIDKKKHFPSTTECLETTGLPPPCNRLKSCGLKIHLITYIFKSNRQINGIFFLIVKLQCRQYFFCFFFTHLNIMFLCLNLTRSIGRSLVNRFLDLEKNVLLPCRSKWLGRYAFE